MKRLPPIVAVLLAAAVSIIAYPSTATAITLQRHVVIPHGVTGQDDLHRVVAWHVGLDSDHDGIWNGPDGCAHQAGPRSNGGCEPPPAPAPVSHVSATDSTVVSQGYGTSGTTSSVGAPVDINCESGGDYSINTGNGYGGAYQFDVTTWNAYAPPGYEATSTADIAAAPPSVQDAAAAAVPYDAWPNC